MSAVSSAASSGAVLGIALVFLAQQFGLLALTSLLYSILFPVAAAIVGGVVCGLAARSARRKKSPPAPS